MAKIVHPLKIWPEFYQAMLDGRKPFECRINDRNYQIGDELLLQEWCPNTEDFTGREINKVVTFILVGTEFGVVEGYVAMGIYP